MKGEVVMKTLLRFLVSSLLVSALAGIAEAKVKPKNLGSVNQTQLSIAIDRAGFPHIAYQGADRHLYHARFDGRTWQRELVDVSQYYGNAMAIDSQGRIHIVYGAERISGGTGNYPLVHAYFDGTHWQVTDLPISGHNPRIALDAQDHPHVLHSFSSGYAVHDGTNWHFENTGLDGSWYSDGLVLDADGKAHVAYSVSYSGCFHATNKSGSWETTLLTPIAGGAATAIGLDHAGKPHVVVGIGGALVSYTYDGSSWTNQMIVDFNDVDPSIHANVDTRLAMVTDSQGRAQIVVPISLSSGNRYAEVAVFVYGDGTGWNAVLVDGKNTGFYPSIALDANDVAHVAYCGPLIRDRYSKAKWARIDLPDLTGAWMNVAVAGTTVTGALTVTNHGTDKSSKTTATLWLSDDATPGDGDTLLPVTLKIKSLRPGSSVTIPVSFQYGGSLTGKHLIAVIDPDIANADRNRVDNAVAISLGP